MKRFIFCSVAVLLSIHMTAFGIGCDELKTNEQIKDFVKASKKQNPLLSKNISVYLEVSACKKEECKAKNKKLRAKKKETLHLLRMQEAQSDKSLLDYQRLLSLKGPNAPQCMVSAGSKDFACDSCSLNSNDQCRDFPRSDSDSKTIQGTNIDLADFDYLDLPESKSACIAVKKNPKYFQIVTEPNSTESPYDKIVTYYHKTYKAPVSINLYAEDVLRKVYKFFPKYYTQIGENYVSTVARVRTVTGSEKNYVMETQFRILKNNGTYQIFDNPLNDPKFKDQEAYVIFKTNN